MVHPGVKVYIPPFLEEYKNPRCPERKYPVCCQEWLQRQVKGIEIVLNSIQSSYAAGAALAGMLHFEWKKKIRS